MNTCTTVDELVGTVRERWPATSGRVVEIREWVGSDRPTVRFQVQLELGDHKRPVIGDGKNPLAALVRLKSRARCQHGVESMVIVNCEVVCTVCQAKAVPEAPAQADCQQDLPLAAGGKA